MAKYLYEVNLDGGSNNPNYHKFLANVAELNAKSPDYAGIQNLCVLSHHVDKNTVHRLCTDKFKKGKEDVTVIEITKKSLISSTSMHRLYTDLVKSYFLPHDHYPNIE